MASGWFRKLTVAGPVVFKSSITSTTAALAGKTVSASQGLVEGAQKLTHSTGQATLNAFGLSVLSATANSTYTLGPPAAVGVLKQITMSTGTTTLVAKTTTALVGTTRTKLTRVASKAALNGIIPAFTLVGATGSKWALVSADRSSASSVT